ncbi:MAG: rRNA pseudouridine synthase [Pirellulales bacterium]|nr:rRNA pseudouridine synthase [Pirellulales bacterium]
MPRFSGKRALNKPAATAQEKKRRRVKPRPAPARANPAPHGERLQKVLAAAGIASRRESEQLILEGRVEVDGQIISELGMRVDRYHQTICVDGEPLPRPKLVYFAVHKPEGFVCTAKDPAGRPRVTDLLPPGIGRVFSVGRLDMSSEGLILLTNDGELANKLTHPRHGVEKTYDVQVAGHPDAAVLAKLKKGMHLAEGFAQVVHVRVKSRRKNGAILEMVLDEGRNREVRRLLARVGHRVQRLTRIAVGPIRLAELPSGAARKLSAEEVKKLRSHVRTAERKPRGDSKRAATRQASLKMRKRKRQAADGKRSARRSPKGGRR